MHMDSSGTCIQLCKIYTTSGNDINLKIYALFFINIFILLSVCLTPKEPQITKENQMEKQKRMELRLQSKNYNQSH